MDDFVSSLDHLIKDGASQPQLAGIHPTALQHGEYFRDRVERLSREVSLDGSSEQRVNGRAAMHNETAETELCCATHSCEGYVVEDGFCRLG